MLFRKFRQEDFPCVLEAYDQAWGWEQGANPLLRLATARFYVADMIATSDEVVVAEEGRVFQGLACLVDPLLKQSEDDAVRLRFREIAAEALRGLAQMEGGKREVEFMEQLARSGKRLEAQLREQGIGWDAELLFLLCAGHARGRGVGKAIADEVFARLRSAHHSGTVMLKTDTHCSWQFYPKNGWRQVACYPWSEAEDFTAFAFTKPIL